MGAVPAASAGVKSVRSVLPHPVPVFAPSLRLCDHTHHSAPSARVCARPDCGGPRRYVHRVAGVPICSLACYKYFSSSFAQPNSTSV